MDCKSQESWTYSSEGLVQLVGTSLSELRASGIKSLLSLLYDDDDDDDDEGDCGHRKVAMIGSIRWLIL